MNERISYLYKRYLDENCTLEEKNELFSFIEANPENLDLQELLDQTWTTLITIDLKSPENAEHILSTILTSNKKPLVKKTNWYRYGVAASILILFSATIYFYTFRRTPSQQNTEIVNQILPGTNKATLTLANGKIIYLDSTLHGEVAKQNGILITKTADGQLTYQVKTNEKTNAEQYNTISTPRGGQYQVNLPDGTKIWLNSTSTLRYSAAFIGEQRRVELSGEAYFEVAKDADHPFVVVTHNQEVKVLGTHFNINSYTDERSIKTTLVEGSVLVSNLGENKNSAILKPGQQSTLKNTNLVVNDVDTDEAIAWKNGYFQFNEADLPSIMRQLSRWYDIDVTFESKPSTDLFHFKVPRKLNLIEVLKIFETNGINFKIEGRALIVKS